MFKILSLLVFGVFGWLATVYAPEGTFDGIWSARGATSVDSTSGGLDESPYRFATIERGNLLSSVAATGALAPVATVLVSSQVSGQVKELHADFNTEVRSGDVIALIDPVSFEIAVEVAEAERGIAGATLVKAQVMLREAEAELERREALSAKGAGSVVERNKAEAAKELARAQVLDATSLVRKWEASLKQARTELERTRIRSPVDGVVVQRTIEVGQIVAVSLQAPTLFTIAQDLREMQVNASIDESEIGRIFPGQQVEFTVDAHLGKRFTGAVHQIRKASQTVQNVVTYTVVVWAANPELLLLPGMTATARFIIDKREDVLSVPSAALRFTPTASSLSAGQNFVWVDDGGNVRPIQVKVGLKNDSYVEIAGDGLKEGMRVAVGRDAAKRPPPSLAKRLIGII